MVTIKPEISMENFDRKLMTKTKHCIQNKQNLQRAAFNTLPHDDGSAMITKKIHKYVYHKTISQIINNETTICL